MNSLFACSQCKRQFTPAETKAAEYVCPDCGRGLVAVPAGPRHLTAVRPLAAEVPEPAAPVMESLPAAALAGDDPEARLRRFRAKLEAARAGRATAPASAGAVSTADGRCSEADAPAQPATAPGVRLVLPPPRNEKDADMMVQLLSSLVELPGPVAFEIAGDEHERKLLIRGAPAVLDRVSHQLGEIYEQLDLEMLPAGDDPALQFRPESLGGVDQPASLGLTLRPEGPEFLSLKTWREFAGQDPLCTLLGAFNGLQAGEGMLAQIIVRGRAPGGWSEPHLRQLAALERRGYGSDMPAPAGNILAFFAMVVAGLVMLGLAAWMLTGAWWRYLLGLPAVLAMVALVAWLWGKSRNPWNAALAKSAGEKLKEAAYLVDMRLYAVARDERRAQTLLGQLQAAYRVFDTVSGNHLATHPLPVNADPRDLTPGAKPGAILSVNEIAGCWHMPVEAALRLVKRQTYERCLPRPADVSDPAGVAIGVSRLGLRSVNVALSAPALNGNMIVIGRTQHGKSTLMERIAAGLMADPARALLVIDPHGDLAQRLIGLVPPDRVGDVIYINLADDQRSPGINLLDVANGEDPAAVAESVIDVGKALWEDYWGPRMIVPMSEGLKALTYANAGRAKKAPETQFTILALETLLTCGPDQRRQFLRREVPTAVAPAIHRYFEGMFQDSSASFREQVLSPVLSKAHAFVRSPVIQRVVGQPRSTVDFYAALRRHKIIIVNTNSGVLGDDLAGFIGSLLVNLARRVIMRQAQMERSDRVRVTVVADEFHTMTGVDWGRMVGDLQKYGANYLFGTQAIDNLQSKELGAARIQSIFAGVLTTVVLRTNGADAEYLTKRELDEARFAPESVMNLPRGHAYIKTVDATGRAVPAFSVALAEPLTPSTRIAERVRQVSEQYSVPAAEADRLFRYSLELLDEYARPEVTRNDATAAGADEREAQLAAEAAVVAPDAPEPAAGAAVVPPSSAELEAEPGAPARRPRGAAAPGATAAGLSQVLGGKRLIKGPAARRSKAG